MVNTLAFMKELERTWRCHLVRNQMPSSTEKAIMESDLKTNQCSNALMQIATMYVMSIRD